MKVELGDDHTMKLSDGVVHSLVGALVITLLHACSPFTDRLTKDLRYLVRAGFISKKSCNKRGYAPTSSFIELMTVIGVALESIALRVILSALESFNCVNMSLREEIVRSTGTFTADDQWYDVVRRCDKAVVYIFPADGRYLVYRVNGLVSLRTLLEDEEIFIFNGFMQFATRLGYRLIPPSDIIPS